MSELTQNRPRYRPDKEFPPYTHIPGETPHPTNDPAGHSYPGKPRDMEPLDIDAWKENPDYLYAIDLFNYGYYWEAHEVWEGLWHTHNREGITADFLQGLIKLAAAGVKIRQETDSGASTHARRAGKIFTKVQRESGRQNYSGLNLEALIAFAKNIDSKPAEWEWGIHSEVTPVFDKSLPIDW